MEEPRVSAGATLHVLLASVQIRFGDLGRHLVKRGENVVGNEHDRLGSRLRVATPGAQDLIPCDARGHAVGGEDGLDRLAAPGLEDAQLRDAPQLFLRRGPGFTRGGEEEIKAGLARPDDGVALRRDAG